MANKDTEFGIARKGKTIVVAQRQGTPAGKPHKPWQEKWRKSYATEDEAKKAYKKNLDKLIAKYPDNVVRTGLNT